MNPTIMIILLGCNVFNLLVDRMETTYSLIQEIVKMEEGVDNIHLFLSGGKKNSDALESEAILMKKQFEKYGVERYFHSENIQYILDEKSVNTAENFIRASHYLNTTEIQYDEIYVVTSQFHHKRAEKMLGKIDPSRMFQWVLGEQQLHDSNHWENIHIRNVDADVEKAKLLTP